MEQENESISKRASGASRRFSMPRGGRGSTVSPATNEKVPPPPSPPHVLVLQAAAEEAFNQQKEKLNKFLAPITCTCGVIAMGGVGFNVYLGRSRRSHVLESSTIIMLFCFFFFLSTWVAAMRFIDDLGSLKKLEKIFYGLLLLLLVAFVLAGLSLIWLSK